jgi:ribonucleoside-diphosphate reductase beta chain
MNIYDISKPTNYLNRTMFLDPAGPVTIQRFEEVRYPRIEKYNDTAEGFFWRPQETTLTKDKLDFKESGKAVKHIFTQNLLRQTTLDSFQDPATIFTPVSSVPELNLLVKNWSFFESNIHSKAYSHIIRNIYNVPKDQFDKIHDTAEIVSMASNIGEYYNSLHEVNSQKTMADKYQRLYNGKPTSGSTPVDAPTEYEHLKAVWLALNASYGLEAIRFMVSFATSLAMVENKIFIGNGNIIGMIMQDELLHTDWSAYLLNQNIKDDPRFAQLKHDCADEVYEMYMGVIKEEKQWSKHVFREGVVIGLNSEIMCAHVDYTAEARLRQIGIKYREANIPRSAPLPWFNKHADTSKKQTALQENESTAYVLGAMEGEINYDSLPDL